MVNGENSVSKLVQGISANQLASQFQSAAQSQFSGQLDFWVSSERKWSLYFRLGRLIWTVSSDHRVRRWYRLLKQFCPTIQPNSIQLREPEIPFYWEYLVLSVLFKRQHISREQAIALIQAAALEVLFDLLHASEQITQSGCAYDKQEQFGDPLAPLNAEQLLAHVQQAWTAWYSAGLVHYSPNAVPVIKRPEELKQCVTAKTYQVLEARMTGETTLRDLASVMGQELLTLTRVLAPHIQRDLIELRRIPDLPLPNFSGSRAVTAPVSTNAPLIVCIDDSLQVCGLMEKIVGAVGYRCMSVQDSVHALPLLLEHKPGLIFLDLVMPIASGYEICSQIRRISAFKNIPVVILTGNDGIVDRVRARMVGASDFLAKPVNAEKVLAIARQYLPLPAPAPAAFNRRVPVSQPVPVEDPYEMGEATAFLLKETIKNVSGSL